MLPCKSVRPVCGTQGVQVPYEPRQCHVCRAGKETHPGSDVDTRRGWPSLPSVPVEIK